MGSFSLSRCAAIFGVLIALYVALIVRVGWLQTYGRERTILRADRQQHETQALEPRRGDIDDRNGLVMAGTVEVYTLFVDPKFMQDYFQSEGHSLVEMDEALTRLGKIIGKDSFALATLLGDRSSSRFVKIAENLDEQEIAQINALHLKGIGIVGSGARCYPMGSLAAHILGGCGADGQGLDGLELKYNHILSGQPGFERETKDARREPIGVDAADYLPPQNGQHLVLTIDANLQLIGEEELASTIDRFKAKRGEFIAMDPRSGEILAMASYPTYNPQTLSDSVKDMRRDSALVSPYEPGSIFKPFIVTRALDWHVTTPWEVWSIPGITWLTPYGRVITDDYHYGNLSTWDVLVKSSNIGMSQLGERLGNARLYQAITSFGFGKKTGVDLPGEDPGLVYPLVKWKRSSTESIAQGYEVEVTPIQIARAFSAIANGGRLVHPHLFMGTVDADGSIDPAANAQPAASAPFVDPEATAEIRRILCDVPIRGTARGHRSRTWNIAGKTGTAYIAEGHGYSHTKFNSSFMAMAPYENPRIVVVMVIHEADKSIAHFGGDVAAPGACDFLERALAYMDIPSSPDLPLPPNPMPSVIVSYDEKQYTNRNFGAPPIEKQAQVTQASE